MDYRLLSQIIFKCNTESSWILVSPVLGVDKTSLDFGNVIQGTVSNKTFLIYNEGTGGFSWYVSADQSWISFNVSNDSVTAFGDTVTVSINTSLLNTGTHTGTITITSYTENIQGSPKNISVSVTVTENIVTPILTVDKTSLTCGEIIQGSISNQTVTISNSGSGQFIWNASADQTWITVNPISGTVDSTGVQVAVSITTSSLALGTYTGTITISSSTPNIQGSPKTIIVSVTVTENTNVPIITVDKTTLNWGDVAQEEILRQTFTISNTGTGYFTWSGTSDQTWMSINPTSGDVVSTDEVVAVTVNTSSLGLEMYTGTITISSSTPNVQGSPKNITVSFNVDTLVIPGHELTQNETWNGKYILKGDIVIPSGITLTIMPGTIVKAVTSNLDWDGGFEDGKVDFYSRGTIKAIGTQENIIVLTSNDKTPEKEDWWGIGMTSGSLIDLQYCCIAYSYYGIFLFSTTSADPVFKNCLWKCTGGIVDFGSENITITQNTFTDGTYGYNRWEANRKANLSYCVFKNNYLIDVGITGYTYIADNTHVTVKHSNFITNGFYNLRIDGEDGGVLNSSITADSCYGITNTECTGVGNEIIINSPMNSQVAGAGCGFTSPFKRNSLPRRFRTPSKSDIEKRNKLIMEYKKKDKNYRW